MTTIDRPLRRSDHALSPATVFERLNRMPYAVLSTADADGRPYGTPVSPVWHEGRFYIHGTKAAGRRNLNLSANPFVSLTFVGRNAPDEPAYSMNYESVIADGRARRVTDPEERRTAFLALARRWCPSMSEADHEETIRREGEAADVWAIEIERICGKSRGLR